MPQDLTHQLVPACVWVCERVTDMSTVCERVRESYGHVDVAAQEALGRRREAVGGRSRQRSIVRVAAGDACAHGFYNCYGMLYYVAMCFVLPWLCQEVSC